jgi:hypothetical protein
MTRDPRIPPPIPPAPNVPSPPVIGYAGLARPCPGCGSGPIEEPSFTWWGGLVGHKLLSVEQCRACRKWWVKGSNQSGDTRVMIYFVVGIVLGVLLTGLWIFARS